VVGWLVYSTYGVYCTVLKCILLTNACVYDGITWMGWTIFFRCASESSYHVLANVQKRVFGFRFSVFFFSKKKGGGGGI